MFVTEPAAHTLHATVDSAVYCPAAQAVHVEPPWLASVSVTKPAAHTLHATVDCGENVPASHAEQLLAPTLDRELVTEPEPHEMQSVLPLALWYDPAGHAEQPVSCPPP